MISEKCELLVKNRAAFRKKFSSDENLMYIASGLLFTLADREADPEKLEEYKKLLKKNTGFFSNLRSTIEPVLVGKMALAEDPEKYLCDVKAVYEKAHRAGFKENSHMVLACLAISDLGLVDACDEILDKAKEIMKRMEKDHPFLTSSEDTSVVMLLALCYKDVDTIISDLEEGYDYLKKSYRLGASGNGVQNLCEVLVISYGDMKAKCDKVARIYNAFKKQKYDFGSSEEFSTLGVLAEIDLSPETLSDEIIKAAEFLKDQEGFGDKEINRKERLMYAALLAADAYGKDAEMMNTPVISNTLSIISAKRTANMISVLINISANLLPAILEAADASGSKGDAGEKDSSDGEAPSEGKSASNAK